MIGRGQRDARPQVRRARAGICSYGHRRILFVELRGHAASGPGLSSSHGTSGSTQCGFGAGSPAGGRSCASTSRRCGRPVRFCARPSSAAESQRFSDMSLLPCRTRARSAASRRDIVCGWIGESAVGTLRVPGQRSARASRRPTRPRARATARAELGANCPRSGSLRDAGHG